MIRDALVAAVLVSSFGSPIPGMRTGEPGMAPPRAAVAAASPRPSVAVPGSQVVSSPRPEGTGSELTIYLLTMGYGDEIWERFGHNAIRIVDASRGTDSVYHWGAFDFAQPHFLRRFMTGDTEYWMKGEVIAETMAQYHYLNRSVWAQELDLTPAERIAVRDYIAWNARPENLYYRYDYYLDNCSTRVRDILDRAVGGQLESAMASRLTGATYRFHTQRALRFDRAVALGTDIGLGEGADRPITQWEEAFLPGRLQEHIRSVQVTRPDGTRPLVKAEQQLFAANRGPEPTEPASTLFRNLLIGIGVAAVAGVLARAAMSGRRRPRLAFVSLATTWVALNGILGVILIVGWTATRHVFMVRNENLLQFNALSLGLAVLLPLAVMRGRAVPLARGLAVAIAAISVVGLAMKVVPAFGQHNVAIIALTLPAHLVIAWAVRALPMASATAPSPRGAAAAAATRSAA